MSTRKLNFFNLRAATRLIFEKTVLEAVTRRRLSGRHLGNGAQVMHATAYCQKEKAIWFILIHILAQNPPERLNPVFQLAKTRPDYGLAKLKTL